MLKTSTGGVNTGAEGIRVKHFTRDDGSEVVTRRCGKHTNWAWESVKDTLSSLAHRPGHASGTYRDLFRLHRIKIQEKENAELSWTMMTIYGERASVP